MSRHGSRVARLFEYAAQHTPPVSEHPFDHVVTR